MNTTDQPPSSSKTLFEKLASWVSHEPQDREELQEILEGAHERGILNTEALSITTSALQVSDMNVREVMIPRSQCVFVKASDSAETYIPTVIESAHSRFPVLGDDSDDVLGILLAKDLLPLIWEGRLDKINLKDLIRPATFVPESKRLNILLREFRATRNHMAIVVNEYGGMAGLVTIEDVLEQIVGDIEDEHDFENDYMIKSNGREFIVKAITPVDEFNEHFKTGFSEDDFDTIGGIVTQRFGRLPKRDEAITIDQLKFRILNSDNRKIRLLQVSALP